MLTVLQQQLGEAHGLAIAASETVDRVEGRVPDARLLDELRVDAGEIRGRCLEAEGRFGEEVAAEILQHANSVAGKAADLAVAWFKAGTGPLEAWAFLAMGESGEVAAWSALCVLAERLGDDPLAELAAWGTAVQRRHLELVLDGATPLAEQLEPLAPRFG